MIEVLKSIANFIAGLSDIVWVAIISGGVAIITGLFSLRSSKNMMRQQRAEAQENRKHEHTEAHAARIFEKKYAILSAFFSLFQQMNKERQNVNYVPPRAKYNDASTLLAPFVNKSTCNAIDDYILKFYDLHYALKRLEKSTSLNALAAAEDRFIESRSFEDIYVELEFAIENLDEALREEFKNL